MAGRSRNKEDDILKSITTGRDRMINKRTSRLSSREMEILELLVEGATNQDISKRLYITPNTTKSHVVNIFNKLGVINRTQAAVYAIVNHLIQI